MKWYSETGVEYAVYQGFMFCMLFVMLLAVHTI